MTSSSRRTYRHRITVIIGQKEMSQMPKASGDSVSQVRDFGVAQDRSEDLPRRASALLPAVRAGIVWRLYQMSSGLPGPAPGSPIRCPGRWNAGRAAARSTPAAAFPETAVPGSTPGSSG